MKRRAIDELLAVVKRLRGPRGCPWDRQQTHQSLKYHLIEEAYEVLDAIEAENDHELEEELGDLLLHIVLHSQIANERGAFDFQSVARRLVKKLVHRHPHVFGARKINSADAVLAQWDSLKAAEQEKAGKTRRSALDGIPKHLPALERAQKLWKKAVKAKLAPAISTPSTATSSRREPVALPRNRSEIGKLLFDIARHCQDHGWHAEDLLRAELRKLEQMWRKSEHGASKTK